MKKLLVVFLVLIMTLALYGCKPVQEAVIPEATPTVRPTSVLNAVIAEVRGNSLLIAGIDTDAKASDIYEVSSSDAEILDTNGKAFAGLTAGMSITVKYDGVIEETYPARIANPSRISVISDGGDLIGFYRSILDELYASDDALNDGIDTLAFDFSELNNLRDSEKTALMYLLGNDTGLNCISGTYEELCEQGLIDKANLYFPTGVLLKIATADEDADSFSFSSSKWRGGLGALGSDDNKAKLKGGVWSYEPGGFWIS